MSEMETAERLILLCACGFEMEVTRLDMGREGACPKCGRLICVARDNTRPASQSRATDNTPPAQEPISEVIKAERYDEAIPRLKAALEHDDTKREVWYALAYCQYQLRNWTEAQQAVERALDLGHMSARRLMRRMVRKRAELSEMAEMTSSGSGLAEEPRYDLPPLPPKSS